MRIAVTGATGMLGREIMLEGEHRGHEMVGFERNRWDVTQPEQAVYWVKTVAPDTLINCAGIVPARLPGVSEGEMVEVNALAPFYLAAACRFFDTHLLQISTDCVFDGARDLNFPWLPYDIPNATDVYGRSKALGELVVGPGATVVRTSFIGPAHGLWRWYTEHEGPVEGWANARWSGQTVDTVASYLLGMAETGPDAFGPIVHLATSMPTTKAEVLLALQAELGGPIVHLMTTPVINRWMLPDETIELPSLTREDIARLAARE